MGRSILTERSLVYEIELVTREVELLTLPYHRDEDITTIRWTTNVPGIYAVSFVVIVTVTATGERFAMRKQFYEEEPVGMWMRCPVCHAAHMVRTGDQNDSDLVCPCGMYCASHSYGNYEERVGYWFNHWFHSDENPSHAPPDVIAEARRLLDDLGAGHFRSCCETPVDWLVFSDWLDEHDYPLTAANVRGNSA